MKGDKDKSAKKLIRWIEATCDGLLKLKSRRVPSYWTEKKEARRRRRRLAKNELRISPPA